MVIYYFLHVVIIFSRLFCKQFSFTQNLPSCLAQIYLYLSVLKVTEKIWILINFRIFAICHSSHNNLKAVPDEIILFCVDKLKDHQFPRDDYKEFIELVFIFLEEIPPSK